MPKLTEARLVFHHTMLFARGEALYGLVTGLVTIFISWKMGSLTCDKFQLTILVVILVYVVAIFGDFFFNLVRHRSLPRRLSRRQVRRIIAYLKPYCDDGRIVFAEICYDPKVDNAKEARDYANDIISAIRQSGCVVAK